MMKKMLKNIKKCLTPLIKQRVNWIVLLLIFSIVSISCATKAPLPPKVDLLQPIINVQVCENGECRILNVCKRWRINDKKEWVLVGNEDLKESCNGIFGVNVDDFVKLKDYSRKLESWIGNNCGSQNNGQP